RARLPEEEGAPRDDLPRERRAPARARAGVRRSVTRRLAALAVVAAAIVWGAWIRIDTARSDPGFDARDARGLLRSDPALLYYITERIVDAGGVPADFRADPRIQHPFVTDVPAEFPVGQEFLVAGAQRFSGATPLHVTALRVMSVCAALFVAGTLAAV